MPKPIKGAPLGEPPRPVDRADEVSECCEAPIYHEFAWPVNVKNWVKRGLVIGKDFRQESWVTFCVNCDLPCKTFIRIT